MPGRHISSVLAAALIGAVPALGGCGALARPLSSRPTTVISPFAAGASTDFAIRVIAQKIADNGGPKVVVDNRPGGGGVIAANAVKAAAADGSTLLLGNVGIFAS